ncbi:MAG: HEPN domain-containing protein [bacterium]
MKEILEKKYKAIDEFKRRVLKSKFGDHIAKMVLFGSVLREEAYEDSDIDLLIFSTNSKKEVEKFLDDVSSDIWWETGESVEALLFPISELRFPTSWLVYRTLEIGKEVYSMSENEIKEEEQKGYAELARLFVEDAKRNLADDAFRAAVDLAYNGAELAVKGLLLFKPGDLPSTHRGVMNRFGDLFARTGEVKTELGRRLRLALGKRNQARYVFSAHVGREDAEEVINLAEVLLAILERRLK